MEVKNENQILEKLKKISNLIPDEVRSHIADYVATKLTINRRDYIENLNMVELKKSCSAFEKVSLIFDESNVFNLKA